MGHKFTLRGPQFADPWPSTTATVKYFQKKIIVSIVYVYKIEAVFWKHSYLFMFIIVLCSARSGVGKLRPAGQLRPAKEKSAAREHVIFWMECGPRKKNLWPASIKFGPRACWSKTYTRYSGLEDEEQKKKVLSIYKGNFEIETYTRYSGLEGWRAKKKRS